MKRLFLIMLFFCLVSPSFADPHDCMSREDAEKLVQRVLEERYLVNFCDCCYDLSGSGVLAKLIYVKNAAMETCSYDDTRFSVRMTTEVVGSFEIQDGGYAKSLDFEQVTSWTAVLNYQFFFESGKDSASWFCD